MTKQLERLMFVQGERCFFCEQSIPEGEASVEHLIARANGGVNGDENCVACCKSVNALLSSHPLKEKLRVVLNQKGRFKCPKPNGIIHLAVTTSVHGSSGGRLALVVADLKKRGPSRPRRSRHFAIRLVLSFRRSSPKKTSRRWLPSCNPAAML